VSLKYSDQITLNDIKCISTQRWYANMKLNISNHKKAEKLSLLGSSMIFQLINIKWKIHHQSTHETRIFWNFHTKL